MRLEEVFKTERRISITYENIHPVDLGQEFATAVTKNEPEVQWDHDPDKFYTLLMFDPDAISKETPLFANVVHWLVVNIPGCEISEGELKSKYAGPGPPKNTKLHRYIFVVFQQDGKLDFSDAVKSQSTKDRMRFNLKKFMDKYDFKEVHAMNYFEAQYDHSVGERSNCFLNCFVCCLLNTYCCVRPCMKE